MARHIRKRKHRCQTIPSELECKNCTRRCSVVPCGVAPAETLLGSSRNRVPNKIGSIQDGEEVTAEERGDAQQRAEELGAALESQLHNAATANAATTTASR
jgi:hypothetical protein